MTEINNYVDLLHKTIINLLQLNEGICVEFEHEKYVVVKEAIDTLKIYSGEDFPDWEDGVLVNLVKKS